LTAAAAIKKKFAFALAPTVLYGYIDLAKK
jgi:hypothetical protein